MTADNALYDIANVAQNADRGVDGGGGTEAGECR